MPVDVLRVKPYMNCLFDPARVRVTINKLYFVPEWLVSGVVGMPTEIPEAWMPTIKKTQQQENRATADRRGSKSLSEQQGSKCTNQSC